MPTGFLNRYGCRRSIALIAIAALVLQTVFAALASGQLTAQITAAPGGSIGVICHGAAAGEPAAPADPGKDRPDCCIFCTAAAVAIVKNPVLVRFVPRLASAGPRAVRTAGTIVRTLVRDGRSQAPPSLV